VWLDNLLKDFIAFIQKNNFIITPSEKISILNAISQIDITNKKKLFSIFYSIIVKDKVELDKFTFLFDTFFENIDFQKKDNIEYKDNNSSNNSIIDTTLSSYKFNKYDYASSIKYFILNDNNRIDRLIRLAVSNLSSLDIQNMGNSFNQIKNSLSIDKLEDDIDLFKKELIKKGASSLEIDDIINKMIKNLKLFKKKIRLKLKEKLLEKNNTLNILAKKDTNIIDIENIDINILEKSAQKIVEKLKKKKKKRFKNSKRGTLNMRKTLNKSISYNQIPFQRVYKKQKQKQRKLIILADASDSVKKYSQIVLYFIYSLNIFFKNIKTFAFISDIEDVTNNFKENTSFSDSILNIINKGGNSDYNSSFDSILNNYSKDLDHDVILIVIGDGRNNYISADLTSLIKIQKKVKEIIWLNPDNKFFWNTADSNIELYQKVVDKIYQIRTIEDIESLSEEIIFK
jgi:uncharacterized protein with von Willebrand factor type A (vWA) domain